MSIEDRLAQLGLTLPTPQAPLANYVTARAVGDRLYTSGHLGKLDGVVVVGAVGADVSPLDAYNAARAAAIDILASARQAVNTLDRVRGVVKVTGFVHSATDFTDQSSVVNGASDLFVEVFGPVGGRHARSAVGVAQLPQGAAVEIEAILDID